jgi:predicted NAD/FAD-binding protein
MTRAPRVAIAGAGISGLAAAHSLQDAASITLFEASDYFGSHAHTATIELPRSASDATPVVHGVDTGFLVCNDRTYPNLIRLFGELGVETAASDISFSVQATRHDGSRSSFR